MNWLRRLLGMKPKDISLLPGICECDHPRCCHVEGKGECRADYPPDEETPRWTKCACQVFILDRRGGDGGGYPESPVDPAAREVRELERMRRL